MINDITDLFINSNLDRSRKIYVDFCGVSPMYDVVARKVFQRHIELDNGHWLADFSTQDYLGISFDPEVIDAAIRSTKEYGAVVAWCRLVATVDLFDKAEKEIAALVGAEAASIFASTTLLNHGVIPALLGNDGILFLDKSGHATMYEGAKIARDSGATLVSFPSNDVAHLEVLLKEHEGKAKKLIAVDGVNSMTGDYADLSRLDALAKKYNALLYIDDAHGFGVVGEEPDVSYPYGKRGNGLINYYNIGYENALYIGCFSKAYGTYGAFVACSKKMRNFLFTQATPHDLGGHGPASAMAALLAGLEINRTRGDVIRRTLYKRTMIAKKGLTELGFTLQGKTNFPILSVWLGSSDHMLEVSKILFKNHILVTLAPYPAVRKGQESIRITVTATNTLEEITQLILAFGKVKEYLQGKGVFFPKVMKDALNELDTVKFIDTAIRANNKIWNKTYYDDLMQVENYIISITPSLPQPDLNCVQAVRTSDVDEIEKRMISLGLEPAIYTDPNTPQSVTDQLSVKGYKMLDASTKNNQTEVWRVFDLTQPIPNAQSVLKIPERDVELHIVDPKMDRGMFNDFLIIDQKTNKLDDKTIAQLKKNILSKDSDDTKIFVLVAKIMNQPVSALCLGFADRMGFISEAGTIEEHRGKGLFPWLRIKSLEFAKECRNTHVISNTLESNTSSHRSSDKSGFIRAFKRELWIKEGYL